MNRTYVLALATTLLAAPFAFAHVPPGPKDFCESTSDWYEHDYVGAGSPVVVGGDGNVSGDCNGDGIPADYDGHGEWGVSAAWLKVSPAYPCDDGGEVPHHPVGGPIRIVDILFSSGNAFDVTADTVNLAGTDPCGDNVADEEFTCVDWCTVPFGPGTDGYYVVFIESGTAGHVYSP